MELVTASELARQTGLSTAAVGYHVKSGRFPAHEDSSGRRRFHAAEVLEIMERDGIKPRPRKDKGADADPEQVDTAATDKSPEEEEAASSDALPAQAVNIIAEALRRSKATFRKSVQEQLVAKANDGEDPLEQESELVCLRVYMRAPEIFDAVREELSK